MTQARPEDLATKADLAEFERRFANRLYAVAIAIAAVTIATAKLIP